MGKVVGKAVGKAVAETHMNVDKTKCRQRTYEMCMYDLMEMNVRGWGDLVEAGA